MAHYGYSKRLNIPFDEAIEKTIAALKQEGFGVLMDIDIKKTLKEKINADFKQYRILGACNPKRAYGALQSEDEIGLLLPCNVVVYEKDDGVVVSMLRPTALFSLVDNPSIAPLAEEVEKNIKRAIDSI